MKTKVLISDVPVPKLTDTAERIDVTSCKYCHEEFVDSEMEGM